MQFPTLKRMYIPPNVDSMRPQRLTSHSAYLPQYNSTINQEASYIVPLTRLREEPEWVQCPFCHQIAKTRIAKDHSGTTM